MSKIEFNVCAMIDFFGGVNALSESLNAYGNHISVDAIYKWKQRNSIPFSKLQTLIQLAQNNNLIFNINDFIQNNKMEQKNMNAINQNRVYIFDTTLRDGEQSPGASMTKEEKIRIALQLEKLGVDVIEAGFAAASRGDFDAIHTISGLVKKSTICSLARANEKDIRAAGEAISPAPKKRIHIFIATSPLHMKFKLKKTPEEIIKAAIKAIEIAKEYTNDIEFSAEDAFRSDVDFLVEVFTEVIKAGATTINVPDTVGYTLPSICRDRFSEIIHRVPGSDKVIWSTHCHDDLGMAVANSIAALEGGVRQIECTINGLGERAGNASLEEVVMAIKTRQDILGLETHIDTQQILSTSKLVSTITGYPVPANKAVVGANAFAHESGIHQDGILKCRETYEIMSAESVGWKTNRLTLGKLSGRNAFRTKLEELGILLSSEEALNAAFIRFKDIADKKREIFDEDLHALVSDEMGHIASSDKYRYISLKTITETGEPTRAKIFFARKDEEFMSESEGSGAVDAIFKAIELKSCSGAVLELYSVNAITSGTESQGEVTVRLSKEGKIVSGQGSDLDIVIASAKAYLSALSKLEFGIERFKAQGSI